MRPWATEPQRTALVTGATGYIGSRLVPALLDAGWRVVVLARTPRRVESLGWAPAVQVVEGDATDQRAVQRACAGVDAAYFLLHSMDGRADFERRDRELAQTFATATKAGGVGRLVYLSGLHPEGATLSAHLRSRTEVGRILLDSGVPTVVLQAAVILGSGSASFEMLRHLTRRLPVMVAPKWLGNRIQPIAIRDVLACLVAAATLPPDVNRTFDIGGPDVLTYAEMIQRFARADGLPPAAGPHGARAHAVAGQPLGRPGHTRARVHRQAAGRQPHPRGGLQGGGHLGATGPASGGLLGFDAAVAAALEGSDARPAPGSVDPAHLTSADPDWAGS